MTRLEDRHCKRVPWKLMVGRRRIRAQQFLRLAEDLAQARRDIRDLTADRNQYREQLVNATSHYHRIIHGLREELAAASGAPPMEGDIGIALTGGREMRVPLDPSADLREGR